jgi:3-hydroxyacyl-CoA dehydrogenase/enoyl-CoA hydratase/3-hydroxybutyryl-CoA epimerase
MIQRQVRDGQICVLTFDRPGSAANIFDTRTLIELGEELDYVTSNPQLKGLVLASAKPSIFIAGVDLNTMTRGDSFEEVQKLIELGQSVINRVAALSIPTVAAIHGVAVGGGYEICLACDYRIASADRVTKIGLPETQLGLLPAWGGSTRLPRLIGLPKALDVILGGKTLAAKKALKYGMVDEVVPAEYLLRVAAQKIGRGKPNRERHLATNNRIVASLLALRLRKQLRARTRGNYPAIPKALEVMARGVSKSVPQSLALEREGISELIRTPACRNLIRVFFLQERAKKLTLPGATPAVTPKPIKRTAVIGAGVMGAGIAQWLSARELPVILRDLGTDQVAGGMATISRLYKESLKRRILSPCEARAGMDRIYPAPSEVPLRQVDLVIEAAVEKLELKKNIFRRLDELAGDETLLATNTSALPISELAAGTRHPERVLGLHFFNPVHRMQLVEIIAARQTSPEVLRRALRFVQQIGKQPVVVKDSPGFLVNRILMPYLLEAGNLFEAGASLKSLDEAMLDFGMPMGPLRLLDEVGLDVALHVAQTLAASFGNRMAVPELLSKMIQAGLLGRKNGRGFYCHDKGKESRPNVQAVAFARNQSAAGLTHTALQERMSLLMINESARCLEEEIVSDPADVDFAMIMGTGFAPFRGGPLRYADTLGAAKLTGAMERLVESGATHFQPSALLRDMAANGKSFYGSAL